jgi:putative FmdB family regulatory protein
MPTYEYECTKCGRIFEVFHSMTAKPRKWIETDCAKCDHRAPVRRLIGTGAGVIFKGSGFYETDYRSESYKKAEKAEKEAGSPAKSKQDGKGESSANTDKSSTSGKSPEKKKSTKADKAADK